MIDPPGPFAPGRQWEEFLVRVKSLPQDDPGVQEEIRNAKWTLAQTTHGETNDVRDDDQGGWPDRRFLGKHEREIEAESVAYIISWRAGVVTRSAEYLKTHAEKADMSRINIDLIVRASARIEKLAKIHYGTMLFKW